MFYRAVETGTLLGFGAVTSSADISEGGQVVSPNENNRRAAAMRKLAATMPPAGTNVVVVSHKPNIMDAFGKDWFEVREGEASVFRPDGNGYKLVVRIQAADWGKLAQTRKLELVLARADGGEHALGVRAFHADTGRDRGRSARRNGL